MKTPTEERFLYDVKNHKLEILLDNGIYRHLRLSKPNECHQYYEIITFPEGLLIRGDMGCYEFERNEDMFMFFRIDEDRCHNDEKLPINDGYWAEKIKASCRRNGYCQFDIDIVEEQMQEDIQEYIASLADDGVHYSEEQLHDLEVELTELVNSIECENDLYREINSCHFHSINKDADEIFNAEEGYSCKEYSYNYIWCLYAIVYAIKLYDEAKNEKANIADQKSNQ